LEKLPHFALRRKDRRFVPISTELGTKCQLILLPRKREALIGTLYESYPKTMTERG
jgi:hypothetical protein